MRPPFCGHGSKWAGCGVIPVYRDLRQFPKYNSEAVLNLKVARKEGSRGRLSEQFVNGPVPKNGTQLQKGKLGLGLHRSEQLDVEAGIRGVQLPIGLSSTGHGARGISLLALAPALLKDLLTVDGTPTSFPPRRWGRSACRRVWGVETRLGMVSEGGLSACPGSRRVPPCRA